MADTINNTTKKLGPDGLDDLTGAKVTTEAPVKIPTTAEYDQQAAAAPQAGDLDPQLAALVAQLGVTAPASQGSQGQTQAKPDFMVDLGIPRPAIPGQPVYASSNWRGGLSEMTSAGFLGLNNPTLVSLVQSAAGNDIRKYDATFKEALGLAAYYQKSGKNVTVADILRNPTQYKVGTGATGPSNGYGPFSNTTKSVQITNPGAAHALLNQALTGYLGREATADEQSKFLAALGAQERANPQVSIDKGTTSKGGTTRSTSTTGGFDQADFAANFAKSQEGYAEYQASTTYLDAFIDALTNKARVI